MVALSSPAVISRGIRYAKQMIEILPRGFLFCDDSPASKPDTISVKLRAPSSKKSVMLTRSKNEPFSSFGVRLLSKIAPDATRLKLLSRDAEEIDETAEIDTVFSDGNKLMLNGHSYVIRRNSPAVGTVKSYCSPMHGVIFAPRLSTSANFRVNYYVSKRPMNAANLILACDGVKTSADLEAVLLRMGVSGVLDCDLHSEEFFTFRPGRDAVNQFLFLTFDPGADVGSAKFAVLLAGEVLPRPAEFVFDERVSMAKARILDQKSFRVGSYNTLAALYFKPGPSGFFPYCKEEFAHRTYRYPLLLTEISGYSLDIGCFQEVDEGFYSHYFHQPMTAQGYEVVFAKKDQAVSEGCMTIYRKSRFQLVSTSTLVIAELLRLPLNSDILTDIQKCPDTSDLILKLPTVLQVIILRSTQTGGIIVIGNTHLYFHPSWPHLKAIQFAVCLRQLQILKQECLQLCPKQKASVLMCGDLNSTPDSGVYQLATTGVYPRDHPDWSSAPASKSSGKPIGVTLRHHLGLKSACGTPDYTNYTEGFAGCLDYIFIDKDFRVDFVYPMPRHELVTAQTAIPSQLCPSDHLPLLCDLRIAE